MGHGQVKDVITGKHGQNPGRYRRKERDEKSEIQISAETSDKEPQQNIEVIGSRRKPKGEEERQRIERLRLHIRSQGLAIALIGIPERYVVFVKPLISSEGEPGLRLPCCAARIGDFIELCFDTRM